MLQVKWQVSANQGVLLKIRVIKYIPNFVHNIDLVSYLVSFSILSLSLKFLLIHGKGYLVTNPLFNSLQNCQQLINFSNKNLLMNAFKL